MEVVLSRVGQGSSRCASLGSLHSTSSSNQITHSHESNSRSHESCSSLPQPERPLALCRYDLLSTFVFCRALLHDASRSSRNQRQKTTSITTPAGYAYIGPFRFTHRACPFLDNSSPASCRAHKVRAAPVLSGFPLGSSRGQDALAATRARYSTAWLTSLAAFSSKTHR
jgi:hypothetical protein